MTWHKRRRFTLDTSVHERRFPSCLFLGVALVFVLAGWQLAKGQRNEEAGSVDEQRSARTAAGSAQGGERLLSGAGATADEAANRTDREAAPVVHFVPLAAVETIPAAFRLKPHEFGYQLQPWQSNWSKLTPAYQLTFPSPVSTPFECNNTVHCEYFAPRGSGKHPGVIMLHILGGDFDLSRVCCQGMAMHGIGALFVKMPYYGPRRPEGVQVRMISDDLEQTVAGMTQAVVDIRRAAAWLAAREEIDDSRIGITGISLGGIVSALAAALEPRFDRVCLILAGGNLERIILESSETEAIRNAWADRDFDYEAVMGRLKLVDPLTYANRLKSRQVMMFNSLHDTVIPRECTEALWRQAGEPKIHWWNATHYSALWYLPPTLMQISEFFAAED